MFIRTGFLQNLEEAFSFGGGGAPSRYRDVSAVERAVLKNRLKATECWKARDGQPEEKYLLDELVRLSDKMQVPPPKKLIIYRSDKPNAAMVANGTVLVSTDLMRISTPEELSAVMGHELSHHKHGWFDRLLLLATSVIASMGMDIALGKKPRFSSGYGLHNVIGDLAQDAMAMAVATVPQRRFMEYRADREGAELTSPEAMAGALEALQQRSNELKAEREQKFGKPGLLQQGWKGFVRMLDSHPSTQSRVAELKQMSHTDHAAQSADPINQTR